MHQQENGYMKCCIAIQDSAIKKKKKRMVHAAAWMNLKNSMLSERSQSQIIIYTIPSIRSSRTDKTSPW